MRLVFSKVTSIVLFAKEKVEPKNITEQIYFCFVSIIHIVNKKRSAFVRFFFENNNPSYKTLEFRKLDILFKDAYTTKDHLERSFCRYRSIINSSANPLSDLRPVWKFSFKVTINNLYVHFSMCCVEERSIANTLCLSISLWPQKLGVRSTRV